MGVISDAIDSLQEWCENLFKDGIKSQFDSISDLMTETFHKTTEDGGLISTFLTGHPASFSGSASGGTTIWSTIETLCNNVVVPIGGFILVIILLNDLIQTVIRGNNFKDFDDSIFIKWIIKALCGVILVRGKLPGEDMLKEAAQNKLPIMSTEYTLFEACGILYSNGLRGCSRKAEEQ